MQCSTLTRRLEASIPTRALIANERLGDPVWAARKNDAELVAVGIGKYYPAGVAFADPSHEVAAELQGPFGDVVRVVRVEVDVAATGSELIDTALLKR